MKLRDQSFDVFPAYPDLLKDSGRKWKHYNPENFLLESTTTN